MPDLGTLLDWLSKGIALIFAAGALVSFFLREKIKQKLSKSLMRDLEQLKRDHSRELADLSASHQRELEAYKVSLIAEAERLKAAQEIRKTLAIKIGERRFTAISTLLDAVTGFDVAVASHAGPTYDLTAQAGQQVFIAGCDELLGRMNKLNAASDAASPFLATAQKLLVVRAKDQLTRMLSHGVNPANPRIPREDPRVASLFEATHALETDLRDMLHAMEDLG